MGPSRFITSLVKQPSFYSHRTTLRQERRQGGGKKERPPPEPEKLAKDRKQPMPQLARRIDSTL